MRPKEKICISKQLVEWKLLRVKSNVKCDWDCIIKSRGGKEKFTTPHDTSNHLPAATREKKSFLSRAFRWHQVEPLIITEWLNCVCMSRSKFQCENEMKIKSWASSAGELSVCYHQKSRAEKNNCGTNCKWRHVMKIVSSCQRSCSKSFKGKQSLTRVVNCVSSERTFPLVRTFTECELLP